MGGRVPVAHAFEVPLRLANQGRAIAFVDPRLRIHARAVVSKVVVEQDVALVVERAADEI